MLSVAMAQGANVESPQFDPGGFYEFNVRGGAVKTRDGARVMVLTGEALGPLVQAAASSGDLKPIRTLGQNLATHAQASLGSDANGAAPEDVLAHASSVLALFGWGRLGLERWGQALALTLTDAPELDERRLATAALLGGLLSELSGHEVACVPVDDRFLVVAPTVADKIWKQARGGADLPTVVASLSAGEK